MRRDDEIFKKRYLDWKEKCKDKIPGISEDNSRVILNYINDMEFGLNVGKSSKKGGRSYNRLYNLQQRMIFITKLLEKFYDIKDLTKLEERHLHEFFTGMRKMAKFL
jgi:hypothetical protein